MDLKKIKKFFTLARRHDGFTLVELIVVIAILAILGGVAVPAYGGYVKKANMTTDQALVSEVVDALMLHYYSNPGAETVGYVILRPNGAPATADGASIEESVGAKAMMAVFGENWTDTWPIVNVPTNSDHTLPRFCRLMSVGESSSGVVKSYVNGKL
jgi:prepilin-type N-terminal cleavage/methylation domain-containing protein